MQQHRATFITRQDFKEIAKLGLNSVRIPFGYWILTGPRPGEPFVGPAIESLDNAFKWAEEFGLQVVLSYHGTVGFQSDHQASGRASESWRARDWDPDASVEILGRIAARYKKRRSLGGITVVNEPCYTIPLKRLLAYYGDAYHAIRKAGVPDRVQVIMPLYHRQVKDVCGRFAKRGGYRNVVFDVHIYQVFGDDWFQLSLADHLRWAAAQERAHDVRDVWKANERVIVSEWSLALPTADYEATIAWEWFYLTFAERNAVHRSFALRQLRTFAAYANDGWFFWSWKDEAGVDWCLRDAASRGLMPLSPSVLDQALPLPRSAMLNSAPVARLVGPGRRGKRCAGLASEFASDRNKVNLLGGRLKH